MRCLIGMTCAGRGWSMSRQSPAEAAFRLMWQTFAPGYPLAHDDFSIRLPYTNTGRKFKADFVHTGAKVAIEIQGGTWSGGKHGRGPGIQTDALKLALAQRNGWQLYQVVPGSEREMMPLILGAIVDRGATPIAVKKAVNPEKLEMINPW